MKAAEKIARVEDSAIFNGFKAARIAGIIESSPHAPVHVSSTSTWPQAIAQAKEVLRTVGVGGPFALALGPKAYDELSCRKRRWISAPQTNREARRRADRVGTGASLVPCFSRRAAGTSSSPSGKISRIGFNYVEKQECELYLAESFTFRVIEAAAAIALRRG